MRYVKNLLLGMFFCFTAIAAMAGSLNSPAAPTEANSAMYKLEDVYNRANDGTAGTKRTTTYGEPIAAPGSTGKTLTQVYDLVSERSRPAKTGQIRCWDATGTEIVPCDGTGQDGATLKGVTWPSPRFTNNNDGTVTDNLTGLIWLKAANYKNIDESDNTGFTTWALALTFCNALHTGHCGLTDASEVGDWRLPNLRELQSLIDYSKSNPALPSDNHFTGVQSSYYWSSTAYADNARYAWYMYLYSGHVSTDGKANTYYVWPVRGGQ